MKDDKKIALVLFSGGLDSRIAAKMMQSQGFSVHLAFIKLPFGGGCCNDIPCIINFAQTQGMHLDIVDASKGELFTEYVNLVKNPKYGVGAGINPCKDCKIFIFVQGKKLAEKLGVKVIVTGEVLGQRPMSQMKKSMELEEKMSDLSGKILRPLSALKLEETIYEKNGIVDRSKLLGLEGRRREVQMKMALEYKIKYPAPGGGCLLCEKDYSRKLKVLYKHVRPRIPNYLEILFLRRGRMFKDSGLLFIGRNHEENVLIEAIAKDLKWNILIDDKIPGPTIVYEKSEDEELAKKLLIAYREKDLNARKEFKILRV